MCGGQGEERLRFTGRRYAHRLQHVLPLRVVSQAHGIVLPEGIVVA